MLNCRMLPMFTDPDSVGLSRSVRTHRDYDVPGNPGTLKVPVLQTVTESKESLWDPTKIVFRCFDYLLFFPLRYFLDTLLVTGCPN